MDSCPTALREERGEIVASLDAGSGPPGRAASVSRGACPSSVSGGGYPAIYERLERLRGSSPEERKAQAGAFLDLLECEPGGPGVAGGRREEIFREIERHGFYRHTPEELAWGSRFAWRHSVRCVGRWFWRQLEVRDAREARTMEAVAAHCIEHAREATHGGQIRPLVTIFAPEEPGNPSPVRIWNRQLVRYAGYAQGDGEILGDPAERELTEWCLRSGWRGPARRGRFDVLPLLLSDAAGTRRVFEMPEESVLEVPLAHPDFEWFGELDWRWYAVPIVADMVLEIGGIRYPAAPFNGWYVGTEIGARNLADLGRYNLLPELAQRMGIFSRKECTLWRDRALVELNRAVLFSYQKAGVKIVDHHTVGHLHVRFEEEERRLGRPVTGRWDWLVPPLSGATSPLWARSYDGREYSPNFYAQPRAWETAL